MVTKLAQGSLLAVVALLLSACTVVDLDANGQPIIPKDPTAQQGYRDQTAQQVAKATWSSKVLEAGEKQGLSWEAMKTRSTSVKAGSSESLFVRGTGTVTAITAAGENERFLTVTLDGEAVPVAIGPVVRSNAIRDAAGFKFEEFTNQVQYAQLTKALNRQAVQQLPPMDESWVGKPVQLMLAVTLQPGKVQDVIAVTVKQEPPQ
ncbi:DUF2291 family protein [Erwinia sp.]|uniref:DUF2291 family protein n=1 Tax=Erwinia citreus TaxID=558 RepID=UPI003C724C09